MKYLHQLFLLLFISLNVFATTQKNIDFNTIIYNENSVKLELSQKEKEYLRKKATISMCINPDWMPFEKFDENEKYIGISADYFKLFTQKLSIKFQVIPTVSWTQSLEYAQKRKCDLLSMAMATPNRKKYLNFTDTYLQTPLIIATKLDVNFISTVSELVGKKIGITKGYAFLELLKNKYPFLQLVAVDNIQDGLEKVKEGDLFGFVGTILGVGYELKKNYIGELKITGKFEETLDLGIGVKDNDLMLLHILQKTIKSIDSKQKQKILNKWIAIKYEKNMQSSLIFTVLSFIVIIILFVYFRQYRLNKSLEDISEIIDSTMEGIFISRNLICISVNQSAVDMLGYDSKEEMIGKNIFEFSSEDSLETVKENISTERTTPYEGIIQRKDKSTFYAYMKWHNLKEKNMKITSVVDITHLKKLESQTKLASMGEMIGNIAHQWRQPLSVISTVATGMKIKKEYGILEDKEFNNGCEHINENAQYLSQTIDDFRNFISGESKHAKFDLKNDTENFLHLVDSTIQKYKIQLVLDLEENVKVQGYPNELIQCFMNIFNNARDALIEHNVAEEERYIFITQRIENDTVIIRFKDNANGIPENIIKKIFDPYFTTKHQSKGTGLGLNMTYNFIVNRMDGTVNVENVQYEFNNKKYEGAEFKIVLPLS